MISCVKTELDSISLDDRCCSITDTKVCDYTIRSKRKQETQRIKSVTKPKYRL